MSDAVYITINLDDGTRVMYDATNERFLSAIESLLLSSESMQRAIVYVSPEYMDDLQDSVEEQIGE